MKDCVGTSCHALTAEHLQATGAFAAGFGFGIPLPELPVKIIRAMRRLRHMALSIQSFALKAYRNPRNERITPMTTTSPTR